MRRYNLSIFRYVVARNIRFQSVRVKNLSKMARNIRFQSVRVKTSSKMAQNTKSQRLRATGNNRELQNLHPDGGFWSFIMFYK